jgi:hypothetical protein
MENPILEQFLYFVILSLMFMSIACFKLSFEFPQNKYIINIFIEKIYDKNCSIMWKFLFLFLKYIQSIVLITLFVQGSDNLNHLKNLGFMIFFVAYTASEKLYRSTSVFLTIFIAFFLLGQYYFSLNYKKSMNDKILMGRLEWLNFFDTNKMPTWSETTSIYFRYTPYLFDWGVLICMSILNTINFLF